MFKIDWDCKFVGLSHHPFWLQLVLEYLAHHIQLFKLLWLRITDEGSVPEMCIWSILLIKSDLKWCTHHSKASFRIARETAIDTIDKHNELR